MFHAVGCEVRYTGRSPGLRRRALGWLTVVGCVLQVLLAPGGAAAADGRAEGQQWRRDHPDWLLPAWTADGPAVWTIVGAPGAASMSLVAPDGSFAPVNHGPSVSFWLYDLDAGRVLQPAESPHRVSLDDGHLPIVTTSWWTEDVQVNATFFASVDAPVTYVRYSVATLSRPRRLAAFVAVRPFGIERDVHAIGSARCEAETATLVADDALVLVASQPADGCGAAILADADLSAFARRNALPAAGSVTDSNWRAGAMLRFALEPAPDRPATLELRSPNAPRRHTAEEVARLRLAGFDAERGRVVAAWRATLAGTSLEAPDQRVVDAFEASKVYLLLNRNGARPRSGPLAHDAFWVRDAAYIGEALERAGLGEANQATVEALLRTQRADGSFPAITDVGGPRAVDEWDAPGQAIHAAVTRYRFSGDRGWLERVYPGLTRAAVFLDALRGRTLEDGPETRTLLPENLSAEDLGSADWHHYWDDVWAIAGYRQAAFAAGELGRLDDAQSLEARADDLQGVLLGSIRLVQARTGIPFVPNGPEDVASSAMARGTTPALWPVRAVRGDAWQELLATSFAHYDRVWLEPNRGAYRHYEGTFWPYGGLGVAHAMLRLGMLESTWRVLEWTLAHPTLPGAVAWGEAVNPRHGGLELGDMPHSWAAAEMISLLRDMVLSEEDGTLVVGSGVPDGWLAAGHRVALRDAPTHYGVASVVLTRGPRTGDGSPPELVVEVAGEPPAGWRVRVPGAPTEVLVDGVRRAVEPGGVLLPTGAHEVRVRYGPSGPTV